MMFPFVNEPTIVEKMTCGRLDIDPELSFVNPLHQPLWMNP
jgi:hypothetical protein